MQTLQSRPVLDGLGFPEGIRWHDGKVWFSDIVDFKVISWDPATNRKTNVAQPKDKPSGLGFLPDGKLLIVTMDELQLLRLDPDGLKIVADLKQVCGDYHHLNDMVVDGQGRAYIGGLDNGDHSQRSGKIVLVDPDGTVRIAADNMAAPNGMAITADGKTLLANDTSDKTITAFDVAADGRLTNRRLFADLGEVFPDGICLDAEGAAWVGVPWKAEFQRIVQGGTVTHRIVYENRLAVAPALGGPDRRTLYLCTSARMPLDDLKVYLRAPGPLPDALEKCRGAIECSDGIAVPGAGWP